MARLIDADALKARIGELCINNDDMFSAKAYDRIIGVIDAQPTVPDVNRAAILRLCNEIEDLASDIGKHTMKETVYVEARMIFDKALEIGKELDGDARTDRQECAYMQIL